VRDVLIADAGLAELDRLLDRCRPDIRVVRVAADEDGGTALAEALAGRPAAIHLLAHGEPGAVRLGARPLDVAALEEAGASAAEADRRSWPQAPDTEILIHACDVGADGGRFAAALARATGARVAAASHPVGHPSLGGSWELDVTTGPVTASLPFSGTGDWVHRLAYSGTPTAGNDTLVGDDTGNTINGLAGNDSITGGTGNDSLVGGDGDDTLVGGGNSGVAAGDTMNGGLGADHYVGGSGFNIVTYEDATAGLTLDLTNGANNTGEAAGDTFENIQRWIGSEYADSLTAGDTAVWFWGHGGNDVEHGGAGNDTLEAGDGNDSVFGGGGNDLMYGRADNDELHGELGDDTVAGGGGADLIYGDAGNDLLKGDWERDTVHGGDGDDTILAGIVTAGSYAQTQADTIFGEAGNDRYIVVSQYDAGTVSFDGGTGTDTLEVRSDDLSSYNGYDLEYHTAVASPTIDLTGMTLAGVERLELTGGNDHNLTLTGAQAAGFKVIAGSTASDTLRIAGSADLSAVALSGIEAIDVTGSGATLTLAASQLAGLALTGHGNALAVAASGDAATMDLSGGTGFAQIGLTGTAGADDLTVGAGTTVTGNGGDDVIRIAAGTTGAVTVTDAAIGDRLVMEGVDLAGLQVETATGSTVLRVGSGLAVTLTGTFEASQFRAGSGGSVTIVEANRAPVAEQDRTVTALAGGTVALGIAAPTDADGDALTVTVTGLPSGGTIRLADGTAVTADQSLTLAQLAALTFTPAAGAAGDAGVFAYIVGDGRGSSDGQTVALQVKAAPPPVTPSDQVVDPIVNTAPMVQADKTMIAQDRVAVSLGIAAPTDPDGDVLTVTVTGLPSGGTVRLADGSAVAVNQTLSATDLPVLTFLAADGLSGDAGTFAYRVEDGHGAAAIQSVALQVVPSADPASTPQTQSAEGLPVGFNALAYIASYPDLIAAFGTNTEAAIQHYLLAGRAEGRTVTFDPLAYVASYPDLIPAFGANADAATLHYLQAGYAEGRQPNFNGLAYIASYPDLAVAFGTNAEAGTRHYIGAGAAEGRTVTFDAYNYLAANRDLAVAFGTNAEAATRHYIQGGMSEGRLPQGFDALRYIASNPDLIQAFGPDVQAAELHYILAGYTEGRSLTAFDPAAYLASHPEIAAEFGSDPAAVELAYIKRSTSTAMASLDAEAPLAITMLAAGMIGSQSLGIEGPADQQAEAGTMLAALAGGDGSLSHRPRTELLA